MDQNSGFPFMGIPNFDQERRKERKGVSSIARQVEEEEASNTIKLEDLAKLVPNVQPSFKDLDSPEDDPVIIIKESDEEENDEIHATKNVEIEDTSVPKSLSLKSSLIQELTNQLKELLVKSLKTKVSNILSTNDFSSSLPTKLKDIPSKLNELTREVQGLKNQVHTLEIEFLGELKEIPTKLDNFTKTVLVSASSKARDKSIPSAGQADIMPAEGEKNTNQAIISQLFQRRAEKHQKTPLKLRGHIKKDKGKKAMSLEDAKEESTKSDSDDETTHVPGSTVESSKKKELKKFDFVTEGGEHVYLTKEQISAQKKIEEEAKAEASRREGEIRKEILIDLLGLEVVNKYYNDKLQYDKYCDKMLNRRTASRITNYDVLTRKSPITLKVYREDGKSEIIPNFKASDLHLSKWREVMKACLKRTRKGWEIIYKHIGTRMNYIHTTKAELGINLDIPLSKQDPLDKLNDHANKKRKHVDDIHDYFKANKRLKSSVQYEDHLPGIVLNEPVLGLDDHGRTFSSLLLAEIDKRNLNPLKQIRVIKQLRGRLLGSVPEPFSLSVLRRLGSIFTSVYAAIQKLKKDSWSELQFSLADNSKLNIVYLLNRS
ncbi:hypothetical protein Tco_0792212 [Tanacetum coccineum]